MNTISYNHDKNQINVSSEWRQINTLTPEGCRAQDLIIATRKGYRPNGEMWEYDHPSGIVAIVEFLPLYSSDVNSALTLVNNLPKKWSFMLIQPFGKIWKASIRFKKTQGFWEQGPTPALAICRAWLAFTDANGGAK